MTLPRVIWNADVFRLSTIDATCTNTLGHGWRSYFYGIAFGRFAFGLWVRRPWKRAQS